MESSRRHDAHASGCSSGASARSRTPSSPSRAPRRRRRRRVRADRRHPHRSAAAVRRARRPHLARGHLLPAGAQARGALRARASSTTPSGASPTTSSSTPRSPRGSASPCRRRCVLPVEVVRRDVSAGDAPQPAYPLDWAGLVAELGFPMFLKPHWGGGWRDVHRVDLAGGALRARTTGPAGSR